MSSEASLESSQNSQRAGNSESTEPISTGSGSLLNRFAFTPLLCVYMFSVHFATVTRSSSSESDAGLSTLIVVVLVLLAPIRAIRGLIGEIPLWTFFGLLVYMLIPTALSGGTSALVRLAMMSAYVALAAVVSRTQLSEGQTRAIWNAIGAALFLSSFLTIIDFAGIINVPYCNEIALDTKLGGSRTTQASGFFDHRSSMAAIFALAIAGSIVLALSRTDLLSRLFFSVASSTGLLALFLTHNRSGVLGPILVAGVYVLLAPRLAGARRFRAILLGGIGGIVLMTVIAVVYPEHAAVYVAKLGFLGLAEQTWESDTLRIDLFWHAIKALASDPLGHGLSKMEYFPGVLTSPHNVITAIIWGAGIFALVWLPLYAMLLAFYVIQARSRLAAIKRVPRAESEATTYALLAWLVNGMTHQTLATGLAWILFGMFLFNTRADLAEAERSVPSR